MSDTEHFKKVFFEECNEQIAVAESCLMRITDDKFATEDLHAVFRAIHSIKGGAGTFGFSNLVNFAHVYETTLDYLRDGKISLSKELGDILLRANDILDDLISFAEEESNEFPPHTAEVQGLLNKAIDKDFVPLAHIETNEVKAREFKICNICFAPKKDLMRYGNDPLFVLKELRQLSEDFEVKTSLRKLPKLEELNPEECYLSFEIKLTTDHSFAEIQEVFDFVEDDCILDIKEIPAPPKPEANKTTEDFKFQIRTEDHVVHSIRVDLERIDRLVNTVGEMVIKQAMVLDQAQMIGSGHHELFKGLAELTQHTRDLQESVMAIRAQPVKAVFSRMPRLVRELSQQLGKDVRLVTIGENTEIDKTVIERLGDPLTHMMRNAVDHGIESVEERINAGKPVQGTIQLSAAHKSGRIVIEIKDDGRGISREKVLAKALANNLIPADHNLSGEEIDQLIFMPGFSTAVEITSVSGRGVGMDVVKKSIQDLGGRINIQSTEGKGCVISLTLPLTLAVMDGMIARVGNECFIIPLVNIIETLRPTRQQIRRLVGNHDILHLRNENITLVYLNDCFDIVNSTRDPCQAIVVVVETEGGETIGLVVDELLNQQQVVIKSLEANYDPVNGISAATILGNGRVALILDVSALRAKENRNTIHQQGAAYEL